MAGFLRYQSFGFQRLEPKSDNLVDDVGAHRRSPTLGARRRNRRLDHRERFRRSPVGGTDKAGDLAARAVDNERGRHADSLQGREHLAGGIGVEGKVRGTGLLEEGRRLRRTSLVDIDWYHGEVLAAELGFELVERRHLLAAGNAPSGPEIQKHDLAGEVLERLDGAVRREGKVR